MNSCKEDTGGIGANVLPKADTISAYESDTTTCVTSMYIKDSCETNNTLNSMLGSYNDPIFGQVKASIYTQILSAANAGSVPPWDSTVGSGYVPRVDSAILWLSYYPQGTLNPYYGNSDPQTIVVDTLEQPVTYGYPYFSDSTLKYGPVPIGEQKVNFNFAVHDTLRVKLNQNWVKYMVNEMNSNLIYYSTYFSSLCKGLYITVSNPLQLPGQGGILYINLYDGYWSNISFYYHNAGLEQYVSFPIAGETGMYFNHIDKNYSTAAFNNVHPEGKHDSISANNLIYVQSMGGVIGRINFPYLHNWSKLKPVVINAAELTIPVDNEDIENAFSPPPYLFVYGTDSLGQPYGLPDQGQPWYGGTYNPPSGSTPGYYSFYITDYIQHVINGQTVDRGLYIIPGYESTAANRVVLYGARNGLLPTTSPRVNLNIFYTPLGTSHAPKKH